MQLKNEYNDFYFNNLFVFFNNRDLQNRFKKIKFKTKQNMNTRTIFLQKEINKK